MCRQALTLFISTVIAALIGSFAILVENQRSDASQTTTTFRLASPKAGVNIDNAHIFYSIDSDDQTMSVVLVPTQGGIVSFSAEFEYKGAVFVVDSIDSSIGGGEIRLIEGVVGDPPLPKGVEVSITDRVMIRSCNIRIK